MAKTDIKDALCIIPIYSDDYIFFRFFVARHISS